MEKESVVAPVQIVLDAAAAARQLVDNEIRCHPGFADLHNRLGLLDVFDGRPDRASDAFREALGINPGYFWAAANLALALAGAGRRDEAMDFFMPNSIHGQNPDFWLCRAALLLECDHANMVAPALDRYPGDNRCYRSHLEGLAHLRLGDRAAAQESLGTAASESPALDRLYRRRELLGPGALQSVNPREAAAPIRVFPGMFELYDFFAEIHARHGFRTRAMQSYEESQTLWPSRSRQAWNLGRLASWLGNSEEARRHYEEAIAHNPEAVDAHVALAQEYAGEGNIPATIRELELACELRPGYADIRYHLGLAYADAGRQDDAISAFRAALSINPAFAFSRLNLALALRRSGRRRDAIGEYEKILAEGRATADVYLNLGLAYLEEGDEVRAEDMFREGVEINPDFSLNYYYLGVACQKQGRRQHAHTAWKQFLERNRESELAEAAQRLLDE